MKAKILMVDDEPEQVAALARILEQQGYEVVIAEDDPEAWYLLDEFRPDSIILDICLGRNERGGFDLLRRIKAKDPTIPLIVLTGLPGEELELRSLNLEAVDFVRKSSSTEVLLARVERGFPRALREPIVIDDLIKIDLGGHRVRVKRDDEWQEVQLEPKEFELLIKLVSNCGRVIPREVLENLFPDAQDPSATLNRYISGLRTRLEPDPRNPQYILTKRGVGYWFKDYR
jgi:two-component system response regulator VicR